MSGIFAEPLFFQVRIFEIPLSSGYTARVKLILPPEVTLHTFATFPLLLQV